MAPSLAANIKTTLERAPGLGGGKVAAAFDGNELKDDVGECEGGRVGASSAGQVSKWEE